MGSSDSRNDSRLASEGLVVGVCVDIIRGRNIGGWSACSGKTVNVTRTVVLYRMYSRYCISALEFPKLGACSCIPTLYLTR